jgi:hypothetical protein
MSKKLVRTNSEGSTTLNQEYSINTNDSLRFESFNHNYEQNNTISNNLDTIYGPENLFFNNIDLINSRKVFFFFTFFLFLNSYLINRNKKGR